MENLSLEKFNPGIAELNKIAVKYRSIKIKGPDDISGYDKATEAIKDLVSARRKIETTGKIYRADALAFQRKVIAKEKELIEIIESVEKDLKNQKQEIDKEREMIRRRKFMPHRKQVLSEIEFSAIAEADEAGILPDEFPLNTCPTDDQLIEMDDEWFSRFVLESKNAVIDAKTFLLQKREADAEKKRLDDEAKANRKKEIEEAREAGRQEAIKTINDNTAEHSEPESPDESQDLIPREVLDLCITCCSVQPIINRVNDICEKDESMTLSVSFVVFKQPGNEAKIGSISLT